MTSQEILTKLKKYVTEQIECAKLKRPEPIQGEPDSYEYVHSTGELHAYREVLHEVERREQLGKWATEVDYVACEVSYEYIRSNLASVGKTELRNDLQEYIKKELQGFFHMSLKFKWEKARREAAKYMYNRAGGGE